MPSEVKDFRVFVADDEPLIAITLEAILKQHGYQARSFIEPLEVLRAAQSEQPDLLLTDVNMTEGSGLDLARELQRIHPACKILLISGKELNDGLVTKMECNLYQFHLLQKPIHPLELLDEIDEMLSGFRSQVQGCGLKGEQHEV